MARSEMQRVYDSGQLQQDTLTRRRRVLGDDHPRTLKSARNLAADIRALGRDEEANQLEQWIRSHSTG